MKKLILASKSPRRREILTNAGLEFDVLTPDVDERAVVYSGSPEKYVTEIAVLKGSAAFSALAGEGVSDAPVSDLVVVAADTMVFVPSDDFSPAIPLGKPKDRDDAFRMLRLLSGRGHKVATGVSVTSAAADGVGTEAFCVTTEVFFRPLSDSEICSYIDSAKPYDKAGAYGIQEKASVFVERISGDYFNVMGLPICETYRRLMPLL